MFVESPVGVAGVGKAPPRARPCACACASLHPVPCGSTAPARMGSYRVHRVATLHEPPRPRGGLQPNAPHQTPTWGRGWLRCAAVVGPMVVDRRRLIGRPLGPWVRGHPESGDVCLSGISYRPCAAAFGLSGPTSPTPSAFTGMYVKWLRSPASAHTLRRTSVGTDLLPGAPLPLELSYWTDDDDVFTVHIPKAEELENLHFVLDNVEALTLFTEAFTGVCRASVRPRVRALRSGPESQGRRPLAMPGPAEVGPQAHATARQPSAVGGPATTPIGDYHSGWPNRRRGRGQSSRTPSPGPPRSHPLKRIPRAGPPNCTELRAGHRTIVGSSKESGLRPFWQASPAHCARARPEVWTGGCLPIRQARRRDSGPRNPQETLQGTYKTGVLIMKYLETIANNRQPVVGRSSTVSGWGLDCKVMGHDPFIFGAGHIRESPPAPSAVVPLQASLRMSVKVVSVFVWALTGPMDHQSGCTTNAMS